jgi:hypothetical protein
MPALKWPRKKEKRPTFFWGGGWLAFKWQMALGPSQSKQCFDLVSLYPAGVLRAIYVTFWYFPLGTSTASSGRSQTPVFSLLPSPDLRPARFLPQKKAGGNSRHGPALALPALYFTEKADWRLETAGSNLLPHQTTLLF